ncbi:unnamed protein product [Caenorhabditis auriculariae]|uniref:Uncharacterized protein n=1 Tax=Caenorhabditis auriculariae TaxID=2777116 RepID=A0A8S1HAN9_9PELO|nr:unnamed protein product [Caenorhabditis auriculariae]
MSQRKCVKNSLKTTGKGKPAPEAKGGNILAWGQKVLTQKMNKTKGSSYRGPLKKKGPTKNNSDEKVTPIAVVRSSTAASTPTRSGSAANLAGGSDRGNLPTETAAEQAKSPTYKKEKPKMREKELAKPQSTSKEKKKGANDLELDDTTKRKSQRKAVVTKKDKSDGPKKTKEEAMKDYFSTKAKLSSTKSHKKNDVCVDDPTLDVMPRKAPNSLLQGKKKKKKKLFGSDPDSSNEATVSVLQAVEETSSYKTSFYKENNGELFLKPFGWPFWMIPMEPTESDLEEVEEDHTVTNEHIVMVLSNTIPAEPKLVFNRVRDEYELLTKLQTQDVAFETSRVFMNTVTSVINLSARVVLREGNEDDATQASENVKEEKCPVISWKSTPTVCFYDRSTPIESTRKFIASSCSKSSSSTQK